MCWPMSPDCPFLFCAVLAAQNRAMQRKGSTQHNNWRHKSCALLQLLGRGGVFIGGRGAVRDAFTPLLLQFLREMLKVTNHDPTELAGCALILHPFIVYSLLYSVVTFCATVSFSFLSLWRSGSCGSSEAWIMVE